LTHRAAEATLIIPRRRLSAAAEEPPSGITMRQDRGRKGYTMCGIVGYTGPRQASRILVDGLKRLEYRGYDSAGIAIQRDVEYTAYGASP
jgi:hypothetical protein